MKTILLLLCFLGFVFSIEAQIRFTEVNTSTESITIKNFGSTSVDISSWQLCVFPSYAALSGMTTSSLNLSGGASVSFTSTISLASNDGELGLYVSGPFNSSANMRDYIQWGSSPHQRESVANMTSPQIWVAGSFISSAASIPYQYSGDGSSSQNGVAFWDPTLSMEDFSLYNFSIYPNPTHDFINFKAPKSDSETTMRIYDIQGKEIFSKPLLYEENINVSKFKSGLYLIKLSTLGKVKTRRFVKI